jgi:hypothetical protein
MHCAPDGNYRKRAGFCYPCISLYERVYPKWFNVCVPEIDMGNGIRERITLNTGNMSQMDFISKANNFPTNKKPTIVRIEFFAHLNGRVGDSLPNDGSRVPKVQGGVNGYLSVM